MQSVKGIGKESAAILIAELPELGHVGRQQISSLTGLAPMNRDSGNKKGRAYIQAGRKNARSALYMPIISAIRSSSFSCRSISRIFFASASLSASGCSKNFRSSSACACSIRLRSLCQFSYLINSFNFFCVRNIHRAYIFNRRIMLP